MHCTCIMRLVLPIKIRYTTQIWATKKRGFFSSRDSLEHVQGIDTGAYDSARNLWVPVQFFRILLIMSEKQLWWNIGNIRRHRILVWLNSKIPECDLVVIARYSKD